MSAPHLRDLENYERAAAEYHEMCCPRCGNGELAVDEFIERFLDKERV